MAKSRHHLPLAEAFELGRQQSRRTFTSSRCVGMRRGRRRGGGDVRAPPIKLRVKFERCSIEKFWLKLCPDIQSKMSGGGNDNLLAAMATMKSAAAADRREFASASPPATFAPKSWSPRRGQRAGIAGEGRTDTCLLAGGGARNPQP